MRAVLVKDGKGPIENLYIGDAPEPEPGPGQVKVQVKAFGLNRLDILQREGNYPPPKGSSEILGVEFAGVVSSLGEGSTKWKVGDEVLGLAGGGAYAEYIVLPETHVMAKPAHLPWAEAASIPEAFLTAFMGTVVYGETRPGDHVLVHAGASGVGIAAIQLARAIGASTVTATTSSKEKLDWLQDIPNGATHGVNYRTQDFAHEVNNTVTSGHGADVIVDFVGQSYFQSNLNSAALDGRFVMLGLLSGLVAKEVNLGPLLRKRLRVQGSTLRSRTPQYQAELIARFEREYLGKITGQKGDGSLRTYIHKTYSWIEIQDAHREMEANKNIGKIIATVD